MRVLDRVTYHAVLRYLDRVLGLPVDDWLHGRDHLNEKLRAEFCCQRSGVTVDDVRQAVLVRPVMLAACAGFSKVVVRYEGFCYVIRDGAVATILTERMHDQNVSQNSKLKIRGRTETRKDGHKLNRRLRKLRGAMA